MTGLPAFSWISECAIPPNGLQEFSARSSPAHRSLKWPTKLICKINKEKHYNVFFFQKAHYKCYTRILFLVPSIWWLFCCCKELLEDKCDTTFSTFPLLSSLLSSVLSAMPIWEGLTVTFGLLQGFPDKNSFAEFVEDRRTPASFSKFLFPSFRI